MQLEAMYAYGVSVSTDRDGMNPIAQERSKGGEYSLWRHNDGGFFVSFKSCLLVGKTKHVSLRALPTLKGVVYVAGPMRGIPNHNFPTFDIAALALQRLAFYVFNPADFDRQMGLDEATTDEDVTPQILRDCLDRDLNAICRCTHIALLPGWEASRGVRPEAILAQTLGLSFLTMENGAIDLKIQEVDGSAVCAVIGARMVGEYRDRTTNN